MFPGTMTLGQFYNLRMVVAGQILFPVACLFIFYLSGYYDNVLRKSRLQDLIVTCGSCIAATLLFLLTALINDLSGDRSYDYYIFSMLFIDLFTCVMIPRAIHTHIIARQLRRGALKFNTVIIGEASNPGAIRRYIDSIRPWTGMHPVSIVCSDRNPAAGNSGLPLPFEPLDDIAAICAERDVKQIVLLPPDDNNWGRTLQTLNRIITLRMPVYMPRNEMAFTGLHSRHLDVGSEPMINLTGASISAATANFKRTADIVVSAAALTILAVPLALTCAAIAITSGSSPIYRQLRLGRHCKPFNIYKLRTMRSDAESDGRPRLSSHDDPRITPLGHFLRKYRLDELPQFWNVLRGDMSLVGPRPERPYFTERIVAKAPQYTLLYQVRPGITSWGMVRYGYASDIDQMIARMRYDLLYVENLSFLLDMKILFYTFNTVITGKGL